MDGFWFYWAIWLLIIGNYFFNDDKKKREKYLIILCLILISANVVIPFFSLSIRATLLIFAMIAFQYVIRHKFYGKLYLYFISACISSIYLFVHYFLYFEPVWLYVSPLITITSISVIICIVLLKNQAHRFISLIAGLVQADIILWIILWDRQHPYYQWYIVGDQLFLDVISLSMLIIYFWNGLENAINMLKRTRFSSYFPSQSTKGKLNA